MERELESKYKNRIVIEEYFPWDKSQQYVSLFSLKGGVKNLEIQEYFATFLRYLGRSNMSQVFPLVIYVMLLPDRVA